MSKTKTKKGRRTLTRREALRYLGAAGVGTAVISGGGSAYLLKSSKIKRTKTSARIVIAGGGAAGLAAASHLSKQLEGAKITIVDARKDHYYQPGFTLVAGGIKPANYTISKTKDYLPKGVTLLEEMVKEADPDSNQVTTQSGQTLDYDYLIVATGLILDYGAIEGMDTTRIGQNGMGSMYHGPESAAKTWEAMSKFADTGGVGLFHRPVTEMKCAGAPLKYTFITEDHLTRRGNRSKAKIIYNANNHTLFSVPIVAEKIRMLFEKRDIQINYHHELTTIDLDNQLATFSIKEANGLKREEVYPYDFINVIPPMRAPEAIRHSPLAWQTGPWASDGWMEVDRTTLRHVRYPNVFGVGDIAGVPKGKTAASVKWQVPVAVDHLVAELSGKQASSFYDGYTSCPMITRLGAAMLIEFDYHDNLTPSFPGIIEPMEELWTSWVVKTMGLKPTYISMLRGMA